MAWSGGAPGWVTRSGGGLALVLVAAVLVGSARSAGLGSAAADQELVSDRTSALLEDLEARVRAAEPGTDVRIDAAFEYARVDAEGGVVRRLYPISAYGLEAYLELVLPESRAFVVTANDAAGRTPGPDERRVIVRARPVLLGP